MDLRVYVDGVARIICDLTRTTTVHDVIIALAQYKGQAGRYSLLERSPDGNERTLSPNELTWQLLKHPEYSYILQQNFSPNENNNDRKRSKSVDGRKTSGRSTAAVDGAPSGNSLSLSSSSSSSSSSTSGHRRTVLPSKLDLFPSLKSSTKKKHPSVNQLFPLSSSNNNNININNNNNNNNNINIATLTHPETTSHTVEQKRALRAPVTIIEQDFGVVDNQHDTTSIGQQKITRTRSQNPVSADDQSALQLVEQNQTHPQHHQYIALLKVLKSQEIQVEQQERELIEKQKEIDYREKISQHSSVDQEQMFVEQLDRELELFRKLNGSYEHLQQQIQRCSSSLEKKLLVQEQMQQNIDKIRFEVDEMQNKTGFGKKDVGEFQETLNQCNLTVHQQEDLIHLLSDRNNDIERLIEQRRQKIKDLENEMSQLDGILLTNLIQPSNQCRINPSSSSQYNSCPSTSSDPSTITRFQFAHNNTVWKLCPSGIWV